MTGRFAKVSLFVLTGALCCGGMGLYGQSPLPVDERTLLKQEQELVKMERENVDLRRELLKAQESAQRGEAAIAHLAELKQQVQNLAAARDEAAAKADQANGKVTALEQTASKLSAELKKSQKDLADQSATIDELKSDVTRERDVAELVQKKLIEEQKAHRATQQAGKVAQERQGEAMKKMQEESAQQGEAMKKLQAELAERSGRIESLEADVMKHLLDVKALEAATTQQVQRIQFLEAEVERHLQAVKTLEDACATGRVVQAALEARIAQLTATAEQKDAVPAEQKDVATQEPNVPEEKAEPAVKEQPESKEKEEAAPQSTMLDELSPNAAAIKAACSDALSLMDGEVWMSSLSAWKRAVDLGYRPDAETLKKVQAVFEAGIRENETALADLNLGPASADTTRKSAIGARIKRKSAIQERIKQLLELRQAILSAAN